LSAHYLLFFVSTLLLGRRLPMRSTELGERQCRHARRYAGGGAEGQRANPGTCVGPLHARGLRLGETSADTDKGYLGANFDHGFRWCECSRSPCLTLTGTVDGHQLAVRLKRWM
jgi:hypothetical protein